VDVSIVEVANEGTKPFRGMWAGKTYVIAPGEKVFAPWEAMCLWCGDPTLVDTDVDRPRARAREYLSVSYGLHGAPWFSDSPQETAHMEGEPFEEYPMVGGVYRHPNLPLLRVTTSTGDQIVTILDDPEGDGSPQVRDDTAEAQTEILAQLQQQVAALTRQLAQSNPEAAAAVHQAQAPEPVAPPAVADPSAPLPEDTPPATRAQRRTAKR
jgi:hypothetical protein